MQRNKPINIIDIANCVLIALACSFANEVLFMQSVYGWIAGFVFSGLFLFLFSRKLFETMVYSIFILLFCIATRPRMLHVTEIHLRGDYEFFSPNILKLFSISLSSWIFFGFFIAIIILLLNRGDKKFHTNLLIFTAIIGLGLVIQSISVLDSGLLNFRLILSDLKYPIFIFTGYMFVQYFKTRPDMLENITVKTGIVLGFMAIIHLLIDINSGIYLLMYNHSTFISCIALAIYLCRYNLKTSSILILVIILIGAIPISRGEMVIFFCAILTVLLHGLFVRKSISAISSSIIFISISTVALMYILTLENPVTEFMARKFSFFQTFDLGHDKSTSVRTIEFMAILNFDSAMSIFQAFFGKGFGGQFAHDSLNLLSFDYTDYNQVEISANAFGQPHSFVAYYILKFGLIGLFAILCLAVIYPFRRSKYALGYIIFLPTLFWQGYWSPGYAILTGIVLAVYSSMQYTRY